ncbi:MAG: hypothetical protein HKO08_04060 [Erythrobacter sp.]|nr:hypothetical protein [Erythrobacter sp.]
MISVILAVIVGGLFLGGALMAGDAFKRRSPARNFEVRLIEGDQFTIRVRGWAGHELRIIFAGFAAMYDIQEPRIVEGPGRVFSIDWPDGLEEAHILFAVNYLHYPRDFDIDGRSILSAARVRRGNLTGIADNQSAFIFVPGYDTHFDRVHVVDDAGQAYLGDFGSTAFVQIDDARMPREVPKLFT